MIFEKRSIDSATPEEWNTITKPLHYNQGSIEAISYIKQQLGKPGFANYCEGNVIKYIHRYRYKKGVEDLKKAYWYLDKLIEALNEH